MKKTLIALFLFITLWTGTATAQAFFTAYVLSPSPGPGCAGKVRFEYRTCTCWYTGGIWVTVNGGGFNFADGPNCGTSIQHQDFNFYPGEYDIVATVNTNSECGV